MQNLLNRHNELVTEEYEIDLAEVPEFLLLIKERKEQGFNFFLIPSPYTKSGCTEKLYFEEKL